MAGADRPAARRRSRNAGSLNARRFDGPDSAGRRTADPGVAGYVEAVVQGGPPADSNTRPAGHRRGVGGLPSVHGDGTSEEARPVPVQPKPKRLAQSPRPSGDPEGGSRRCQSPVLAHTVDSLEWFDGPQEDRRARTPGFADEVDTQVDAVAPVDVEATGGSEHAAVAPGRAAMGV